MLNKLSTIAFYLIFGVGLLFASMSMFFVALLAGHWAIQGLAILSSTVTMFLFVGILYYLWDERKAKRKPTL